MNYRLKIKKEKQKGISLIETIIYVVIFSLLISSIVVFENMVTTSRAHNQMILEVKAGGAGAIDIITQILRNATAINTPSVSANGQILNISTANPVTNPTEITLVDDVLYISEGGGSPIALTNNKVIVSNLIFSNLSRSGTPGAVQIRFTLSNISQSPGSNYSQDFYGSASIR